MGRTRISYFMDNDVGGYYYRENHPMKPHRITMTHNLNLAYGTSNIFAYLPLTVRLLSDV